MSILTLLEAQQRLDAVQAELLVVPRRLAIERWNRLELDDPDFASDMEATERANIIHGLTRRRVRTALAQVDSSVAREVSSLGFFAVAFGDDLVVRFKFVGNGAPSNVATQRQRALARHQFEEELMDSLVLEGIPQPPTMATCGYTLGYDGKLKSVSVQCNHSGRTLWHYVIWGDNNDGFGNFAIPSITPELDPDATIVRSTRKVREADVEREAE